MFSFSTSGAPPRAVLLVLDRHRESPTDCFFSLLASSAGSLVDLPHDRLESIRRRLEQCHVAIIS